MGAADIPDEFFSPAELAAILETPQPAKQREVMRRQGVPFIVTAAGHNRVYRDRLLPETKGAQNDAFDFSALAGRKTKATTE